MALHDHHERPKQGQQKTIAAAKGRTTPLPARTSGLLGGTGEPHPEYLSPDQAGEYLGGLSTSFLAKLRMEVNRHCGPPFVKIGRVILYRRSDLDGWIAASIVGDVS